MSTNTTEDREAVPDRATGSRWSVLQRWEVILLIFLGGTLGTIYFVWNPKAGRARSV